ncbi:type I secretion system permease/ATPase [Thioclava litoralis]|uniref:Type I secretion system permease/ATPase n=1 Tax=Thioclava litoralis TaxID=3076557 RepID=A0ABZ1E0T0_9RHOB|nr:type I secretion system permease/ATPase [Thioclava sp. FTW29]
MPDRRFLKGKKELNAERQREAGLLVSVAVFSAFVNLLMMTGPMFMLQVYDRVLASRAEETLASLFLLVVFLYTIMGTLDFARAQLMSHVAKRMMGRLESRVFAAVLRRNALNPEDLVSSLGLVDLDAVQKLLGSRILLAIFDMPWSPLFFMAIFIFHPLLGLLALGGGAVLIAVTLLNRLATRGLSREAAKAQTTSSRLGTYLRDEAELLQALGMQGAAFRRWRDSRSLATQSEARAADRTNGFTTFTRSFRQLLQSAMLALGAWVVLRGEMSAGAMIAGSILMGRALSPVETVIGGWSVIMRARDGWNRLPELLDSKPAESSTIPSRPAARIWAKDLTVFPPGARKPALRAVSFRLEPGQALGVIGPSGCGKTTLARTLCGVRPIADGHLRLDHNELARFQSDTLGQLLGYLPQNVTLFEGTIAENIARMKETPSLDSVIEAAKRADAHDMILDLPDGYETRVQGASGPLSGGQIQRIGLARALYGDPVLLILDEPNANLDADGSAALNHAIREMKARRGAVIVMAHRPAAITECDMLLMLDRGQVRAYGPRQEVLSKTVRNAKDISQIASYDRSKAQPRHGGPL